LSQEAVAALQEIADLSGISKRYKGRHGQALAEAFRLALGDELFINRMLDESWTAKLKKENWFSTRTREIVWPEYG
jgi:hypothetical protein